jgi:CotH kinase protein/Lamin Tail Domain/Secretion system C-terminal sorting domain
MIAYLINYQIYSKMFKKILLFLLLPPLSISAVFGQDFYDSSRIQEIRLYFTQPNWRTILNNNAALATEPYAIARRVVINGVTFDSVGAKFKGNSSFRATNKKNPFHIELDNVKNQDYQGYKDIKLSNVFADPSFVREALSYELMQSYADLPRGNFANVYVNDTLQGLYTNTEAITKSFGRRHFYSESQNNTFVKGNAPSQGAGSPSLVYLGVDSTLYQRSYEVNSTYGWKELVHLIDTLNNKPAEIEKILDVDRSLWMHAYNILFVNLDSYTGGFTQNYYLWRDDNRRFSPIIWDVNMSFGSFTNAGGGVGTDSLSLAKLPPFLHEVNNAKPLISKLFTNNPRFRKMYIAHLRTMLKEVLKSGKYKTRGEQMQQLIDASVQQDLNKFYTYQQFKSNLYFGGVGGVGGPGQGAVPGVISLMENKIKFLDTLAVMNAVPPVISNIASTPNAKLNDSTWVTAKVTGNVANGVFIGYRQKSTDFFRRIVMYDDGVHKDGAANDGVFGVGLKLVNPSIDYYIWAENDVAGIFSPERAEHDFHKIKAFVTLGDIVINELMASNTKTATDNNGQYEDWVELYNKSTAAVNIGGYFISDDPTNLNKWKIPANTTIPANGYLIVWADEDSAQNTATSLHANFKLSASGEGVYLSNSTQTLLDDVVFGAQRADFGYARRPNGTGNFVIQTPTYNANNNTGTTATADILAENDVKIFPNPANTEGVTVQLNANKNLDLKVFNTLGQLIFKEKIMDELRVNTQTWQAGIYIFKIGNINKKIIVE